MLRFVFLAVAVVIASKLAIYSEAADKEYPPILLLNQLMGMASEPLPFILRKVIRSCEGLMDDKQEEILENSSNCLQGRLPSILDPNLGPLNKYKAQCALLPTPNSKTPSCYAEMMEEIKSHDCLGNSNYTDFIFKYAHTLIDFVCQDPVRTRDHVNKTEDLKTIDNRKIRNKFYCDESNRRKPTENCIIKNLDRNYDVENPISVCDDFNIMKTCLEKNYIASCRQPDIPAFFGSVLTRLELAVCNETSEIPSYMGSGNHTGDYDASLTETKGNITIDEAIRELNNTKGTGTGVTGAPTSRAGSDRTESTFILSSICLFFGVTAIFRTFIF